MSAAIETTCQRCGQRDPAGVRDDAPGCYRCRERERAIANGLRWARVHVNADAPLWKRCAPLGWIGSIGRLGNLSVTHFHRGYWVVSGNVPIAIAEEVYADPVGRDLIRAGGHCGCVPPLTQATWRTSGGQEIIPTCNLADLDDLAAAGGVLAPYAVEAKDKYVFDDDPASLGGVATVDLYHIDGDLGLRVFVDILTKHGLHAPSLAGGAS